MYMHADMEYEHTSCRAVQVELIYYKPCDVNKELKTKIHLNKLRNNYKDTMEVSSKWNIPDIRSGF